MMNKWNIENGNTLCDTKKMDICHCIDRPIEYTTSKVSPKVYYGLWVIIMWNIFLQL
jgi:hypothetical protein